MRIVFMGTPEFAVCSLQKLLDDGNDVTLVVTKPDARQGRGKFLSESSVAGFARQRGIEVIKPERIAMPNPSAERSPQGDGKNVIERIREAKPDVIVVVAYGKILPKEILEIAPCINVHGSLLPAYRGAAPIQWSVINGEEYGGVTTMFMSEGLDDGDILLRECVKIDENETSLELYDKLKTVGAHLLAETLAGLKDDTLVRIKQDDSQATFAPMLKKEMSRIDFSKDYCAVHNLIRGLSGIITAYTMFKGKRLLIFSSAVCKEWVGVNTTVGEVLSADRLIVGTGVGAVELLRVQPEGKNIISGQEFIRGYRILKGDILQ